MGTWMACKRPEGIEQEGEDVGPCVSSLKSKKYVVFSKTLAANKKTPG